MLGRMSVINHPQRLDIGHAPYGQHEGYYKQEHFAYGPGMPPSQEEHASQYQLAQEGARGALYQTVQEPPQSAGAPLNQISGQASGQLNKSKESGMSFMSQQRPDVNHS